MSHELSQLLIAVAAGAAAASSRGGRQRRPAVRDGKEATAVLSSSPRWDVLAEAAESCAGLEPGDRRLETTLSGVGVIAARRKFGRVLFLDMCPADGEKSDASESSRSIGTLQVVVSRDMANQARLRVGTVCRFVGSPGKSRTGRSSVFVTSAEIVGLASGASPAFLAALLLDVEHGGLSLSSLSKWLSTEEAALRSVLAAPPSEQRAFCSRRARWLSSGRERRTRARPARLAADEWRTLERYKMWSDLLQAHTTDAGSFAFSDLGPVDPLANLSSRFAALAGYAVSKKRPQVQLMAKLIGDLLDSGAADGRCHEVVDVGGGRGDLALAVAWLFPHVLATVWETHAPSLEHGRARAAALGLHNVRFRCCGDVSSLASELGAGRSPLVVALHACGGLTDAALDICSKLRLPFCICPCCYASLPSLRPAPLAPEEDFAKLARIAEGNGLPEELSAEAARAINALRLHRLRLRDGRNHPGRAALLTPELPELPELPASWDIRVWTFPKQWSSRNCILSAYPLTTAAKAGS